LHNSWTKQKDSRRFIGISSPSERVGFLIS
jgi:hypothetical protein